MKKLIMIVMAMVMVAVFMPKAEAGDSAQLGLQVTFKVDHPPVWVIEPQNTSVAPGERAIIRVLAKDPDGDNLTYGACWYLNGIRQPMNVFPKGASWFATGTSDDPTPRLVWDVPSDIDASVLNEFQFDVMSDGADTNGTSTGLFKKISVLIKTVPIISIDLEGPNPWVLDGVKLGERRSNMNELGIPVHSVHNAGNVSVSVGIKYFALPISSIHPGLEQGVDTFITMIREMVIPPDMEPPVVKYLEPGKSEPIRLTYGAPTALSQKADSMSVGYELRAYKAIIVPVDPIEPIVYK